MAKAKKIAKNADAKSKRTSPAKKSAAKGKGKAAKSGRASKRSRKPQPRFRLVDVLPSRVTDIEAVKSIAKKVDDAAAWQDLNVALDKLQARSTELFEGFQGRADELEETARERFDEQIEEVRHQATTLKDKAQETRAAKLLQELPERATTEFDDLLARLGLMRISSHDENVETLRNRYKGLMKAAATKARNQALKEAKVAAQVVASNVSA